VHAYSHLHDGALAEPRRREACRDGPDRGQARQPCAVRPCQGENSVIHPTGCGVAGTKLIVVAGIGVMLTSTRLGANRLWWAA